MGPRTGVMFYVTQQEFLRVSQELALIAEHTLIADFMVNNLRVISVICLIGEKTVF
jgi:hypothetical protein